MKTASSSSSPSSSSTYVRIICTIGIILSSYALYVEHKTHGKDQSGIGGGEEEEFQALCDIEAIGASCRWDGIQQ